MHTSAPPNNLLPIPLCICVGNSSVSFTYTFFGDSVLLYKYPLPQTISSLALYAYKLVCILSWSHIHIHAHVHFRGSVLLYKCPPKQSPPWIPSMHMNRSITFHGLTYTYMHMYIFVALYSCTSAPPNNLLPGSHLCI